MAGAKVSWIYIYIYRYKRPKCTLHRYLGACNWRNRTHYVSSVTLPPFCTHASPPPFSLPRLSSFLLALFISLHPPLHLPSNVSSSSSFLLSFFFFFLSRATYTRFCTSGFSQDACTLWFLFLQSVDVASSSSLLSYFCFYLLQRFYMRFVSF